MASLMVGARVTLLVAISICVGLLGAAALFWITEKVAYHLYPNSMMEFWSLQAAIFFVVGLGTLANTRSPSWSVFWGLGAALGVAVVCGSAWVLAKFAHPCHLIMLFFLERSGGLYIWVGLSVLIGFSAGCSAWSTPYNYKLRR